MKSNRKWYGTGGIYKHVTLPGEALSDKLPNGVYDLQYSEQDMQFYLNKTADCFEFGHKLYGVETRFIDRVLKTYQKTNGNLGILFNGTKGTGKTVTTKQIANLINNPIITVGQNFGSGLVEFFSNFDQNITIVFDEFEKVFKADKGEQDVLLGLMDGVVSSANSRKVFLLTTNEDRIQANFTERPSRIRYVKHFGNLSLNVVKEILDDLLESRQFEQDIINLVNDLNIVTIDILKQIINEVNIHNESPYDFKKIFNIKDKQRDYKVTNLDVIDELTKKGPEIIGYYISHESIQPTISFLFKEFENQKDKEEFLVKITEALKGRYLVVNHNTLGKIQSVDLDNKIINVEYEDEVWDENKNQFIDVKNKHRIHFSLNSTTAYVL